jgi:hypothetical protein
MSPLRPFRFTLIGVLTFTLAAGSLPMPARAGVSSDTFPVSLEIDTALLEPVPRSFPCVPPPELVTLQGDFHIVTRATDDSTIEVYINPVNLKSFAQFGYIVAGSEHANFTSPENRTVKVGASFVIITGGSCASLLLPLEFTLVYNLDWVLDPSQSTVTLVRP